MSKQDYHILWLLFNIYFNILIKIKHEDEQLANWFFYPPKDSQQLSDR